jgi:hypothetical protein
MMNRVAVVATVLALSTSSLGVAFADDEGAQPTQPTQITSAQTLVVITPNAPVIVNNSGQPQAAATQALSPPGAPIATQAAAAPGEAPHNEDWNNVSHINGSIVPVGDRNGYLYAFKKNNIQSNPIAWMFGFYQVAGQHALSQNVVASLELSGWSTDHGNESGYSVAATLPIYFKRAFSGPFLEAGLLIHSDSSDNSYAACSNCNSTTSSSNRTWAGPEVMFGWAWMFDSGLNVSAAFGAARRMSDSQSTDSYSSDSPEPVGYFRVGYAF